MADDTVPHRDLAAFHIYELGRAQHPDQPAWDSDAAADRRTECRFLVTLAVRRAQADCVLTAIEQIAERLARADGHSWPSCAQGDDRIAAAQRRQRYRHLARLAHATTMNYYELGTDDAAYRQHVIGLSHQQDARDKQMVADHRTTIGTINRSVAPKDTK